MNDGESRSYWHYKRSKRYRRTIRIYNFIVAALIILVVYVLVSP